MSNDPIVPSRDWGILYKDQSSTSPSLPLLLLNSHHSSQRGHWVRCFSSQISSLFHLPSNSSFCSSEHSIITIDKRFIHNHHSHSLRFSFLRFLAHRCCSLLLLLFRWLLQQRDRWGGQDQRSTPLLIRTLGTLLVSVSVSFVSTFFSLESIFLLLFLLWSFVWK